MAFETAGILETCRGHWLRRLLLSALSGKMPAAENRGRLGCTRGWEAQTGRRQRNVSRLKKYRRTALL